MKRAQLCLFFWLAACGVPESTDLDGSKVFEDAGVMDAVATGRCARLELDLPFTLLGPGDTRTPRALVRERLEDVGSTALVSPDVLSVRIEGTAVRWREGRFLADHPGEVTVEVAFGDCRVTTWIQVLDQSPFARQVLDLSYGRGAGHGQDQMPDIILGPPRGGGPYSGSLDVLSLGIGGAITLGFGELQIYDGPGPDFIVFENAFKVAGGAGVFAEPGVVSVSTPEGDELAFDCESIYPYRGCAGTAPVLSQPGDERSPVDPAEAGGDVFDLAELTSLADAVRVRDVGSSTTGTNSGFDLDAIALVHAWPKTVVGLEASTSALMLVAGERRLVPSVSARLRDGPTVEGLRVHVHSEAPELVEIRDGVLHALRSGQTQIVFRAGPYLTTSNIEVSLP